MNFKDSDLGLKLSPDSADLLKLAETRMPFENQGTLPRLKAPTKGFD